MPLERSEPARSFALLDQAWAPIRRRWLHEPGPLVVLFSGGVDSGFLAWELRSRPDVTLSTVGTPGSADLTAAESSARRLGFRWSGSAVGLEELRTVRSSFGDLLRPVRPGRRSIFVGLALAIAHAPPGTILCGQGVDELFLGYAHFRDLPTEVARSRVDADLDQLLRVDWPVTLEMARRIGRRIEAPFLDPGFARAAGGLPIDARRPTPVPKALWRNWTRSRGLPEELASRPKRALQFGSGIDRMWKRVERPVN